MNILLGAIVFVAASFALAFGVAAIMGLSRRRAPKPPSLPVTDMPRQRQHGEPSTRANVWP